MPYLDIPIKWNVPIGIYPSSYGNKTLWVLFQNIRSFSCLYYLNYKNMSSYWEIAPWVIRGVHTTVVSTCLNVLVVCNYFNLVYLVFQAHTLKVMIVICLFTKYHR